VHCSASRARNVEALLFMADCMSHKKHSGTRDDEPVFVYLVRSVGHVVRSNAFVRETSTHYCSCLGGTSVGLTKSMSGHIIVYLCFCI
jgi:hypothetical protein